jgi:hypothetical protein
MSLSPIRLNRPKAKEKKKVVLSKRTKASRRILLPSGHRLTMARLIPLTYSGLANVGGGLGPAIILIFPILSREHSPSRSSESVRRIEEGSSNLPLNTAMELRGLVHWIPGEWVWINEDPKDGTLECIKWGPRKPAKIHCFPNKWKARGALTVRGDYRLHGGEVGDHLAECITLQGSLMSTKPHKKREGSIISTVGAGDYFEPCEWP